MLDFHAILARYRFETLVVTPDHALQAGSYDMAHQDPFDRMLAAQAHLVGAELVTVSRAFALFPIRTFW